MALPSGEVPEKLEDMIVRSAESTAEHIKAARNAMGTVLGLDARRIQFTPDLMPSDILGSEVLEESQGGKRSFRFIAGPIFAQLLMADEINRASPRTQSALLQAMQ